MPEPGAGEMLSEVGVCGMNNTDVWGRKGAYGKGNDPLKTSI